jgi:hypothetical protein
MAALVEQQKEERAATVEEQPLASDEPLSEITAVDG